MRVLIVEDEVKLARADPARPAGRGHARRRRRQGRGRAVDGGATAYDAIVLDVMLPGLDGFEVCRRLRERRRLVARAHAHRARRGRGSRGRARRRRRRLPRQAVLVRRARRAAARARAPRPGRAPERAAGGRPRLDPATRRVRRGDAEISLSAKEYALLETFMRRPGQVLDRYQLLEHAWDYEYENRSNVVDVYVRYLREKVDRPFGVAVDRDGARRRLPAARRRRARLSARAAARAAPRGRHAPGQLRQHPRRRRSARRLDRVGGRRRRQRQRRGAQAVAGMIAADRPRRVLYLGDVYEPARRPTSAALRHRLRLARARAWTRRPATTTGRTTRPATTRTGARSRAAGCRTTTRSALGGWRIISLNSETPDDAAQLALPAPPARAGQHAASIAFMHRPRFNAGEHHDEERDVDAIWQAAARPRPAPARRPRPRPPALQARRRHDAARDRRRRPRALRGQRRRPAARVLERQLDGALRMQLQPGVARLRIVRGRRPRPGPLDGPLR